MIFEEIINNEYKITSIDKQIEEKHRKELKFLLQKKKKLKASKEIYEQLKQVKVKEIDVLIQKIEIDIKKISDNYINIFIQYI
jgi:hypothetical protein